MKQFTKQLRWLLASLMLVVGMSAWADEETIDFSAQDYSNEQAITSVSATNFAVSFDKGSNSNAPKYYTSGTAIRCYGGNSFTVTSGYEMTKIMITFGSSDGSNAITTDVDTYTNGTWTGSAQSVKFTIGGIKDHRRIKKITVTYTPAATQVATPSISPNGCSFLNSQEVSITCSTSGATIQYSTDGGNTWLNYSSPFTITETTTVQAKATKSGMTASGTATATFTKAKVYTSLQQLQEDVTSTSQNLTLQMTDIYVTAVKNNNAYISDGTYGALIYTTNHGLTAGQKLNGTLSNAQFVLYRGQTEITNFSSTGLTITEEALPAQVKTIDQITAANQSLLVTLENVTYDGTVLSDGTNSITPYTTFMSDLGLENGKTYNITGIVVVYNSTLEIAPRTADDIVEVGGQVDTRTETYIRFTQGDDGLNYPSGSNFTITVGEAFTSPVAWVTLPSGIYLTKSAAKPYLSYSGDNDEVATVNSETGALTFVAGATGTITVTATFEGTTEYKPCEGYYTLKVNPAAVTPTGTGDEITAAFIGISGNSYSDWSDKTGTSGAVYAGNTFGGSTAVQMRSDKNTSGIVTTTSPGKATMVTVDWNTNTSSSRTLDIYGSNTAYTSAADLYNSTKQGTKLGSICIDDATQLVITGDYAYIGIRSNNGALYCDKITIYWETTPDERMETTVTLNPATETYNVNLGDNFTAPTATLAPAAAGTLTYESSDETVATVADNGTVTILAAGTTTITAKFAGNDDYKPSEASYTINVTAAAAVEAPVFSVAEGSYTEHQTVTITCATTGASIYYTLDGTEPTTASTPYTAALTISETTTLKAIASDGTNVSTVTTATYTINKPEYYTKVTDLSQIEDGDAVIIVNEAYNVALSTTQNTNNRGEVAFEWMPWIGGSFVQLEGNSTVEKFIIDKDGDNFYFYASRGTNDGYIYAASKTANQLKTTDTKSDNAKATITIENGDATIKFQGDNTRNWLRYNATSKLFACYTSGQQPVQLYVERPASEVEAEQTVTVADAQDCYKTFITPYDAEFDGVDDFAYIVTLSADQKEANLTEVHYVPAGTPIIYKYKTAGTHPITRATSGSVEDVSANVLKVSRGEVTGNGTVFVLNKMSQGIGFYPLNEGKTLACGKCYLTIEKSSGVKFIGFNVDDVATGIETVESTTGKVQGTIYDLQGRRVTTPAHGLYIVGGKKVFIK